MEQLIESYRENPEYRVNYNYQHGMYIFVNKKTLKWSSVSHTAVGMDKHRV